MISDKYLKFNSLKFINLKLLEEKICCQNQRIPASLKIEYSVAGLIIQFT